MVASKTFSIETPLSDCKEIFLSDSTLHTRPDLTQFPNLAENPLLSVGQCYNKKTGQIREVSPKARNNPFHTIQRAIQQAKCAAGDSGGFQVLMGKLPANLDPRVTVQIYRKSGFRPQDKPIQLDLPPPYHLSPKARLDLIQKSAINYHIMAEEMPGVVPVIHGWTRYELQKSYEWLNNPEKLTVGSNVATGSR